MRRKILFIALCCLFAGQYVSAQKVFVKGNMTDISMVTPQTELFLKSKLFKFNEEGINIFREKCLFADLGIVNLR